MIAPARNLLLFKSLDVLSNNPKKRRILPVFFTLVSVVSVLASVPPKNLIKTGRYHTLF